MQYIIKALTILAVALSFLIILAAMVNAQENTFGSEAFFQSRQADPVRHYHRPHRHHRARVKTVERVVVVHKPAPIVGHTRCRPPFESVGDQAISEALAQDAAEKAWQQGMRFDMGELWADPAYAENKEWQCVKSSIGAGIFHRCRLRAHPCRPEPRKQ